jgi:hypothetical protein
MIAWKIKLSISVCFAADAVCLAAGSRYPGEVYSLRAKGKD